MKKQLFGAVALVFAVGFGYQAAQATPINYQGDLLDGVPVSDSVLAVSPYSDDNLYRRDLARYWRLDGNKDDVITITGSDMSSILNPLLLIYPVVFNTLEEIDPDVWNTSQRIDGIFGLGMNPEINSYKLPADGPYTIAFIGYDTVNDPEVSTYYDYKLTARWNRSSVPDAGSTLAMLGLAMAGLVSFRRSARVIK